jgi:hypothetical protein
VESLLESRSNTDNLDFAGLACLEATCELDNFLFGFSEVRTRENEMSSASIFSHA